MGTRMIFEFGYFIPSCSAKVVVPQVIEEVVSVVAETIVSVVAEAIDPEIIESVVPHKVIVSEELEPVVSEEEIFAKVLDDVTPDVNSDSEDVFTSIGSEFS